LYVGEGVDHAGDPPSVANQPTPLEKGPDTLGSYFLPVGPHSTNCSYSLLGFAFRALIWWNLNTLAKAVGGTWFLIGLVYLGLTTRGFRSGPKMIDFSES
jgi:hypothetical protein